MKRLYPLLFAPVYQHYVWGGDRIGKRFERSVGRCAESWEIADRPEGMSRVLDGRLQGKTLRELVVEYGPALLGKHRNSDVFPLLLKIIDAKEPLSVQVHPSEKEAKRLKGEPKTECWFVLEGGPVYVGFKEPISKEVFQTALQAGGIQDLLQKIETKSGDLIFVPGGRIHAIGPGCMMVEIQQNSNTTYRVYDWDRLDVNGRPRPLHLEQAFECIKWDDNNDPRAKPIGSSQERELLLETTYFCVERLNLSEETLAECDSNTFQIFFDCVHGRGILLPAQSEPLLLNRGDYLRVFLPTP